MKQWISNFGSSIQLTIFYQNERISKPLDFYQVSKNEFLC